MNRESPIIAAVTGFLYPYIMLFGAYVILNGHNTPGGGFQGGAVLATLFIGRFIVAPQNDLNAAVLHTAEHILFIAVLVLPVMVVLSEVSRAFPVVHVPFLVTMNVLIGLKVGLGLTIVVFRFGFDDATM